MKNPFAKKPAAPAAPAGSTPSQPPQPAPGQKPALAPDASFPSPAKPRPSEDELIAKHRETLDGDLKRIFEDGTPGRDMTKLDQVRHSALKRALVWLLGFFAVLACIAWAGVFFFNPSTNRFSGDGVKLDIEGPTDVKSGETVTYAIRYRNTESIALGTASLDVRLPKTFTVTETEPKASEGNVWQIGSIAPDKDGLVTIKGVYLDALNRDLDVQAILTYRPADFNSEFQKVTTKAAHIASSVLETEVTGPAKVLPGDKVTFTFTYRNVGTSDFKELRLRAAYPQGFIPDTASPKAMTETNAEWEIAELKAGADSKVSVAGAFASGAEGAQEVKAAVGFLDADDTFQPQGEGSFTADVLKGDFVSALILNGKSENQPLRFGDTLRFAVTYKNTGKVAIGDVTLAVTVDSSGQGQLLDWNGMKDAAEGVRTGNTVTWTKKQIPSLAKIDAGDEGTIDFQVPVVAGPLPGGTDPDYALNAALVATLGTIDGEADGRATRATPIVAKFVSDTTFASSGAYYDRDEIPVGKGPLPPKVGEATTYRIAWQLGNTLHELTDLKISAKLPPNVIWAGYQDADAGDLRFDGAAGKMIWTLNRLPTDIKSMGVHFDVTITPTADQKGKIPTLLEGAIFEATDKVNGYPMLLSAPPVTTAVEGDAAAAGKGGVQ